MAYDPEDPNDPMNQLEDDPINGADISEESTDEVDPMTSSDESTEAAEDQEVEEPLSDETDEEPLDEMLSEELQGALLSLIRKCEQEDAFIRQVQLRKWRRLDFYFNNLTDIFWDEVAQDYTIPDWNDTNLNTAIDSRVINIYRANAEAVIAACSIKVPGVIFFPQDAEKTEDLEKAEECSKVAKLIQKQNKALLIFMKAISIIFNEGTVFAYNCYAEDKKFGTRKIQKFDEVAKTSYNIECPACGHEYGPVDNQQDVPINCPSCGVTAIPEHTPVQSVEKLPAGYDIQTKSGELIDVYGPLNIKVPFNAKDLNECGYLIKRQAQYVSLLKHKYPEIADAIFPAVGNAYDDNWMRLPSIFRGMTPDNTAVIRQVWFRPFQFFMIEDVNIANELAQKFPRGCYCVFINDIFAEAYEEEMDKHWTASNAPTSKTIHGEPLGTNLATIQDLKSEVLELELQTMEHGISEVFASATALDFDKYKNTEAAPGTVYPLKMDEGQRAGDMFYETRTAQLSGEVAGLDKKLDEAAQFTTGSQPSIYGGGLTSKSGTTATEYRMSRAQALQRLTLTWQSAQAFWTECIEKATLDYASHLTADELFVTKDGAKFVNNRISKESLEFGEIQGAEPEGSDQLPMSWEQVKDTVMSLFGLNMPEVNAALFHPANSQLLKESLAISNLYIPGEGNRNKQYFEIEELLENAPHKDQQGNEVSSVQPDPEDDDIVHIEICRTWLVSSEGLKQRVKNANGFRNVQLHMMAHEMKQSQKTAAPGNTPAGKTPPTAAPHQAN